MAGGEQTVQSAAARAARQLNNIARLQARTDRRVEGIAELVRIGLKMLLEDRKPRKRTDGRR